MNCFHWQIHMNDCDWVEDVFAAAVCFTVVLFYVSDACILFEIERMDTVMLRFVIAAVVDTAACDDSDIGIFTDIEVVVYKIIDTALGDDDRDHDDFVFRARFDDDIDTGFVRFPFDLDVLRRITAAAAAVGTDIIRCTCWNFIHISNDL